MSSATAPARPESDSMRLLRESEAALAATESVGINTLSELATNRGTLNKIRESVASTDTTLDSARGVLRKMTLRENRVRVAMIIFAIVMIALIIGVSIYIYKIYHT
jgi:hypothetical protein